MTPWHIIHHGGDYCWSVSINLMGERVMEIVESELLGNDDVADGPRRYGRHRKPLKTPLKFPDDPPRYHMFLMRQVPETVLVQLPGKPISAVIDCPYLIGQVEIQRAWSWRDDSHEITFRSNPIKEAHR